MCCRNVIYHQLYCRYYEEGFSAIECDDRIWILVNEWQQIGYWILYGGRHCMEFSATVLTGSVAISSYNKDIEHRLV